MQQKNNKTILLIVMITDAIILLTIAFAITVLPTRKEPVTVVETKEKSKGNTP